MNATEIKVDAAVVNLGPIGAWVDRAACKDADPDLFMPSGHASLDEYRRAAAVCDRCPVLAECSAAASENLEFGIWGGSLRLGPRRVVNLLDHLYDEAWWVKWGRDRARSAVSDD